MRSSSSRQIFILSLLASAAVASPLAAQDALSSTPAPQTPGAAGGAAPATTSPARQVTGVGADDIIVTARKRDETLLEVPVAVTALSANDINRYQANDLTKLGQLVPQVIIAKTGSGGAGASFSIRGIGSSAADAGIDQTVSVNIDGLQVSRGRVVTQGFFDLQQVEVLKGPQALFFGKNSPGGVISLHTAGATKDLEAYVRAGYEFNADERYVEGAVSGPITSTLGFRVALRAQKMDGYLKNVAGPLVLPSDPDFIRPGAGDRRSPKNREFVGRGTLEWRPTDNFDATLKIFGSSLKDGGESANNEVKCADPNGKPATLDLSSGVYVTDPYGDCKINGKRSSASMPEARAANYPGAKDGRPYTDYSSILTSLTMNYKLGDAATITSVTGYYKYKNSGFDDFDASAVGAVWGLNQDNSSAFSQEVRVATSFEFPVNFVVGGYFESAKRDTLGNGMIAAVGLDPVTGNYNNWSLISNNHGKTYSLFGQAIYNILPNLELAGGVRWTKEVKRTLVENTFVNANFAPFGIVNPADVQIRGRFRDNNFSPEATLSWHPTRSTTLYGAYKTGYKSGGFSNPSILSFGQTIDDLSFQPEKAKGGELGAKGSFLNRKLTINTALYRYKFTGLQLTSFNAQTVAFSIRNAAAARTTGIEADANYAATDALSIRGAVGYNKAKYLNFLGAPCYGGETEAQGCVGGVQDLSGTPLVRAPAWNVSGGVTYDATLTSTLKLGLSADGRYTTGYWMQENQNPVGYQKGFMLVNAALRLHREDDTWELGLIGRNLTNKRYGVGSSDKTFSPPGQIAVAVGRPREIALQGTARF